jgi:hypothetical protein
MIGVDDLHRGRPDDVLTVLTYGDTGRKTLP